MLQRKLLYAGVTRGKHLIVLLDKERPSRSQSRVRKRDGDDRSCAGVALIVKVSAHQLHSLRLASAAPCTNASSLAQAICGWIRPPRPQSVEAMTRSRPTRSAKRRIRSATNSGCSTTLVA